MALDAKHGETTRDFKIVGTRVMRPDGIEKVTGRAQFGADLKAPGMLIGRVLRSPHAHARIRSIDISKAEALAGVKAVVTRADFPKPDESVVWEADNCMAGDKALYDGHAVAAVAAINAKIARQALKLIEVDYDPLPHVVDVDEAMRSDAPALHENAANETVPAGMSKNVVARHQFGHGDVNAGFAEADEILERSYKTGAAHQGYIEPQACLATVNQDGKADLWCTTQGQYLIRDMCVGILGLEMGHLRVIPSEIGGGFGGKTTVFIEPVALALSKKSRKPVKMVMSREEVFRATGPTASTSIDVKLGMKKDGRITAARAELRYQGGAYPGSPVEFGAMSAFAPYDLEHVETVGWDVVTNRPKQAAYRAPGAPMAAFAVESAIDEMCRKLSLDPVDVRLLNASRDGTKAAYGPSFDKIGLTAVLSAAKTHPHLSAPLEPNQGRGFACGFWFNFGGNTCVSLNINTDGTINLIEGNPDIGGTRAAVSQMAAEELGVPYESIRAVVSDTISLGYNDSTDGSRVAFAVGLATIEAARDAIVKLRQRAARIWGVPEDAVEWEDGAAKPAGPNAGEFPPMTLAEIAAQSHETGGPIAGHYEVNADGAGVSFAAHACDIEIDPETGSARVVRYTVFQDAGKAVHPSYVEGQFQGGAAQGIGWALNEEYIYGDDGRLQNPGFLDYRVPVASDLPMIDTVIIEVPNPGHPYGVRGVGETSIVPPLAAIANAVSDAAGVRMTQIPMSPSRLVKAIDGA